jgi:hypothetical protein
VQHERDVLEQQPWRLSSAGAEQAMHFANETGLCTMYSRPVTGLAQILTREAADDEIAAR